ncbi:hypothetical protein RQP46_005079 [Phenoliferia psychrophenolica]
MVNHFLGDVPLPIVGARRLATNGAPGAAGDAGSTGTDTESYSHSDPCPMRSPRLSRSRSSSLSLLEVTYFSEENVGSEEATAPSDEAAASREEGNGRATIQVDPEKLDTISTLLDLANKPSTDAETQALLNAACRHIIAKISRGE